MEWDLFITWSKLFAHYTKSFCKEQEDNFNNLFAEEVFSLPLLKTDHQLRH